MPSCALRYCFNNSQNTSKSQGVTFHKFPKPEQEERELWIKFLQKNRSEETWLPSKHACICSVHFKENDKIITKTGRIYLKKNALPYEGPTECGEQEVSEVLSESVSSSNSIFDNPREIALKCELRKEYAAKMKLAQELKKIKRQNIYLKKKCLSYKMIIEKLTANKLAMT
ncbi:THAP domain-containing protein 5-like [Leptidea sinapis]|uniref:THAP domain-containing protein 5-like n=1 Tax=Leptidea sinapis TaxID=189913 RepID=UPI002143E47C|nr:THAP domain-containing protein 5-like [Leptidea sinapis]